MDSEIISEADLMIEAPQRSARRGYDREEVDAFVDATRSRLQTMASRLGQQQSELQRLESENRSFSRTIDIAVTAAEEVMAEATVTAASAVAEAEAHAADVLEIADRRSAEILAAAEAEAHERVVVAQADARDAMSREQARIEAELEMVAALQRHTATERSALDVTRNELVERLRGAGAYLMAVADGPVEAGQQLLEARDRPLADDTDGDGVDVDSEAVAEATPVEGFTPLADLDDVEADRLDEHTEFFSDDIEDDPSRKWILG
ncbi:MAG: DivIVA domain-containing protein [Acidimicrobiales bacterium]